MHYGELLDTLRECPFCTLAPDDIIAENDTMLLTYSLAPYCENHMLVVSKRHIESLDALTEKEFTDLWALEKTGGRILKALGVHAFSFLFREGVETGKSIPHIHAHVVPQIKLHDPKEGSENRLVLTAKQSAQVANRLRLAFKSINE